MNQNNYNNQNNMMNSSYQNNVSQNQITNQNPVSQQQFSQPQSASKAPKNNKMFLLIGIIAVIIILVIVVLLIKPKDNTNNSEENPNNENTPIVDNTKVEDPKYNSDFLNSNYYEEYYGEENKKIVKDNQGKIKDIYYSRNNVYAVTDQFVYAIGFEGVNWKIDSKGYNETVSMRFFEVFKNQDGKYKIFSNDKEATGVNTENNFMIFSHDDFVISLNVLRQKKDGLYVQSYDNDYTENAVKLIESPEQKINLYQNDKLLDEKIKDYKVYDEETDSVIMLENNSAYIVKEQLGTAYTEQRLDIISEEVKNIDKIYDSLDVDMLVYSEFNSNKLMVQKFLYENKFYNKTEKYEIALPNNYTIIDIEKVWSNDEYIIVTFNDGNVYVSSEYNEFELSEEFSNLNKGNHIVDIAYNGILYLLMDDGYLYEVLKEY